MNFKGMGGFSCKKNGIFPGAHKIGAAISDAIIQIRMDCKYTIAMFLLCSLALTGLEPNAHALTQCTAEARHVGA